MLPYSIEYKPLARALRKNEGLSLYLIADNLGIGISLATGVGIYAIAVLAGAFITVLCRIATLWFAVALGGVAVGLLGIGGRQPEVL